MVVGRFAPSPSGRMHLGNVFAALLAWLYARSTGGELLLRIEDLDPDRCRPEYAAQLRDDLRWLGLDWDREGEPQSRRSAVYAEAFHALDEQGLVYPCYCSRAALHAASAPHASDGTPVYAGTCRSLTAAERAAQTRKPAWRVRVPDRIFGFRDGLQGLYEENLASACGDFIVRRSDGVYAYQLAVVVDDAAMGVTQVVRGRDLLSSTPWQLWLQKQLGFQQPEYCHVPLLVAAEGRRLSKRDGDMDLGAIRASGLSPQSLVGRLAFLAGITDREEPVTPEELIPLFRWENIRKENIVVK